LLGNAASLKEIRTQQKPDFALQPPENLVFQGAGSAGIAYIGGLRHLQNNKLTGKLKRIAGTSTGAIIAMLVAVGYTPDEMEEFLQKLQLDSFIDTEDPSYQGLLAEREKALNELLEGFLNCSEVSGDLAKEFYRKLTKCTGLSDGEKMRLWIEECIFKKTNTRRCTFGELHELVQKDPEKFKELHVFALRLNQNPLSEVHRFSSEDRKNKRLVISDAVCASASIPGVFTARILHEKDAEGVRYPREGKGSYSDGGPLINFPLDAFDDKQFQGSREWGMESNPLTLGIRLADPSSEVSPQPATGAFDLAQRVFYAFYHAQQIVSKLRPHDQERTISIPIPSTGLLKFDLTDAQKAALILAGDKGVENFLQPEKLPT